MRFICTDFADNTSDLYLTSAIEQDELYDSGRLYKKVFVKEAKGAGKLVSYLSDTARAILYSSWNMPATSYTIANYATLRGLTITDNTPLTATAFYWNANTVMGLKCSWMYVIVTETAVIVTKPYRKSGSKEFRGEVISVLTNAQDDYDYQGDTGSAFTIGWQNDTVLPTSITTTEKSAAMNKYRSKQSVIYVQSGHDGDPLDYTLYNGAYYVAVHRAEASPGQYIYTCVREENTAYTFSGSDITPALPLPAGGGTVSRYYAIFRDEKSQNTAGGGSNGGNWNIRALSSTAQYNNITGCSVASNQITLPAGTYKIRASAPGYYVYSHQLALYNVTDSANSIVGTSEASYDTENSTISICSGVITIAAQKVFELRHYCARSQATNGLGYPTNATTEVYTTIDIEKLA